MTKAEIKEYLENFGDKRTVAEFRRKQGDENCIPVIVLKTITECVESLPEEYSTIIQLHYMSKVSLRELAKRMYMSRVAVTKRRDDALDMIANCLSGL